MQGWELSDLIEIFESDFFLFIFKSQMGNCWKFCWNVVLFRTTSFEVTKRTSKQSVSWMSSEGEISNNDGRMPNCMNWYHFEFCLEFLLSKKRRLLQARYYNHLFYSCFYVHKNFLTTQRKVPSFFFSKKTECPNAAKIASVFPIEVLPLINFLAQFPSSILKRA